VHTSAACTLKSAQRRYRLHQSMSYLPRAAPYQWFSQCHYFTHQSFILFVFVHVDFILFFTVLHCLTFCRMKRRERKLFHQVQWRVVRQGLRFFHTGSGALRRGTVRHDTVHRDASCRTNETRRLSCRDCSHRGRCRSDGAYAGMRRKIKHRIAPCHTVPRRNAQDPM